MIKCQENSDYTLLGGGAQMNCDNVNHVFEDAKETY